MSTEKWEVIRVGLVDPKYAHIEPAFKKTHLRGRPLFDSEAEAKQRAEEERKKDPDATYTVHQVPDYPTLSLVAE